MHAKSGSHGVSPHLDQLSPTSFSNTAPCWLFVAPKNLARIGSKSNERNSVTLVEVCSCLISTAMSGGPTTSSNFCTPTLAHTTAPALRRSHAKDQALQKSSWPKRSHLKTVLQHIELHLVVSDVAFHSITVFQRSHPTNRKLPGSRFTEPGKKAGMGHGRRGAASRAPELQKRSFLFARHFFLTSISCDFYVIEKSSAVNAK